MIVTVELVTMIVGPVLMVASIVIWFMREMNKLRKEISDHKLYAAEHYATKEGVTDAVHAMQASIDKLAGRIDRLLDAVTHRS